MAGAHADADADAGSVCRVGAIGQGFVHAAQAGQGLPALQRQGGCAQGLGAGVAGAGQRLRGARDALDGVDHGGADGHAQAALLELLFAAGLLAGARFGDADVLRGYVDAACGGCQLRAALAVVASGHDAHVAGDGAHGGAGGPAGGADLVGAQALLAQRDGQARAHEAAFAGLAELAALGLGLLRADVHVAPGQQGGGGRARPGSAVADDAGALHGNVLPGLQQHGASAQQRGLRRGLRQGGARGGDFLAQKAFVDLLVGFVELYAGLARAELDVAPGAGYQGALGLYVGGAGVEVTPGLQAQVALGLDGGADVGAAGVAAPVGAVPHHGVGAGAAQRAQVEVGAGGQGGVAAALVLNGGGDQVGVAPGAGLQGARAVGAARDVQAGHAGNIGAAALGVGLGAGGADEVEVAPGAVQQAAAGHHGAADVVQVASGGNAYVGAGDAPAQVVDVVCAQAHELAPGNGAGVGQVARQVQVDAVARDQGAAGLQVAVLHAYIHLRHQRQGGAAIGQGDGFFHQPDDVAGEFGHLGG